MAVTKRTPTETPPEEQAQAQTGENQNDTTTETDVSRTENDAKPEGGIDSPNLKTLNGEAGDEGRAPIEGKSGDEANAATADRNSGGGKSLSGVGGAGEGGSFDPPLSDATAPTADPSVKPNPHESIPTHTVGRGDVFATAASGVPTKGGEIHIPVDPDFFDPKNVLDLNDPIATQVAHMQGSGIAVGEGRRVDSRTVAGEAVYNVADTGALGKIKEGDKFYALWLFNPGTDSIRWRNDHIADLISGRMTRNSLPPYYWEHYSTERPPLCERTATGYRLLDIDPETD